MEQGRAIIQFASGYIVVMVIGIIALALYFSGIDSLGPTSDILQGSSGFFLFGLFWNLSASAQLSSRKLFLGKILGFTGTAMLLYGTFQVANGVHNWKNSGMIGSVGYGLLGLWMVIYWPSASKNMQSTKALSRLGFLTAISMMVGFFGLLPYLPSISINSPIMEIVIGNTGILSLLSIGWAIMLVRRFKSY